MTDILYWLMRWRDVLLIPLTLFWLGVIIVIVLLRPVVDGGILAGVTIDDGIDIDLLTVLLWAG